MKGEHKIRKYTWWWFMMIGIIASLVVSMITYSLHKSVRMNTVYAPLIDAVMEIKLEAAVAHLWFEEILSGDRLEDIEVVWAHLDQSDWYARVMLEGGKNQHGTFVPLDNSKMRKHIIDIRAKIAVFKNMTEQRFANRAVSGVGTDIDQRYDEVFRKLVTQTEEAEEILKLIMGQDLNKFRYTQIILITTCLSLTIFVGIAIYRFERHRTRDAIAIRHSNEELRKEITERKQAENALKASEVKSLLLLNSTGEAIYGLDLEGNCTFCNPSCLRLLGYENESQLLGRNMHALIHHTQKDGTPYPEEECCIYQALN